MVTRDTLRNRCAADLGYAMRALTSDHMEYIQAGKTWAVTHDLMYRALSNTTLPNLESLSELLTLLKSEARRHESLTKEYV